MPSTEREEKIKEREREYAQHYTSKAKEGKRKEEKREKTQECISTTERITKKKTESE